MSDTSPHESTSTPNFDDVIEGRRTQSVGGSSRQARPRHNVKFFVDNGKDKSDTSPKRHSLPEIRFPDHTEDSEILPFPPPVVGTVDWSRRKDEAALSAHDKASRHADRERRRYQTQSIPSSRRTSFDESSTIIGSASPYVSPKQKASIHPVRLNDIPLENLNLKKTRVYDVDGDTSESDGEESALKRRPSKRKNNEHLDEARRLVRTYTSSGQQGLLEPQRRTSGAATPAADQISHEFDYVPRPDKYKPSVLSVLLSANAGATFGTERKHQLTRQQNNYLAARLAPYEDAATDPRRQNPDFFTRKQSIHSPTSHSGAETPIESSGPSSGYMTPRSKRPKWYEAEHSALSTGSLAKLLESSIHAAAGPSTPEIAAQRPSLPRNSSKTKFDSALHLIKNPISHIRSFGGSTSGRMSVPSSDDHLTGLADRLASQDYLVEMCKALMKYGAPTHRLEDYMRMASRKLRIEASFQYLPGCMIVSFDDPNTHTSELKLIKQPAAVNLSKLQEIQEVYKDVMHDKYSIMEAMEDLSDIGKKAKRFNVPTLIFMYGIAAVSVGPFAFSARPIDFPIAFLLGLLLGYLQLILATRSSQFSHIFEVAGTFATSFAARGLGSIIGSSGQPIFCFSALAQSSIALILPGWIILSAALELQSRNIIAGSIRMVYAIIYTLFLGFGILIGTVMMGLIDTRATNDITCHMPGYWSVGSASEQWKLIYTKFIWVPVFTVCLAMINQANFKQMPWMIFISMSGYQVNYWSTIRFSQNIQVANALGAFTIGLLANLHSRINHGVAAATMLPAIFVMVPSGLAASGSLVAGLTSANQITHSVTGISIINNGTQGFYDAQNVTTTGMKTVYGGTIFNVGYGMVQVAIGISVGLFLSALVIYPFGKKRSGIFSF